MNVEPGQEGAAPTVLVSGGKAYTLNSVPGWRLRGQPVATIEGREYRSWSPYTSKLAAFLLSGGDLSPLTDPGAVLYLGASYGTTVSHLADIAPSATIYAVEFSRKPYMELRKVAAVHAGVIPLLEDARFPEKYRAMVASPSVLVQDVAQKNAVGIMMKNAGAFGSIRHYFLSVKARSIDSSSEPEAVYARVRERLEGETGRRATLTDISRFEKDHVILSGSF